MCFAKNNRKEEKQFTIIKFFKEKIYKIQCIECKKIGKFVSIEYLKEIYICLHVFIIRLYE